LLDLKIITLDADAILAECTSDIRVAVQLPIKVDNTVTDKQAVQPFFINSLLSI
jgi:hypothetical protein